MKLVIVFPYILFLREYLIDWLIDWDDLLQIKFQKILIVQYFNVVSSIRDTSTKF